MRQRQMLLFCMDEEHTHTHCTFMKRNPRRMGRCKRARCMNELCATLLLSSSPSPSSLLLLLTLCYVITGRCPIHLGILSACDWQPNNNNQSFGKYAVQSACFVRSEISKRAIRFYIINVASSFTVPFLFRFEREFNTKNLDASAFLGVGETQHNAHAHV